jgi:hypothetical protein
LCRPLYCTTGADGWSKPMLTERRRSPAQLGVSRTMMCRRRTSSMIHSGSMRLPKTMMGLIIIDEMDRTYSGRYLATVGNSENGHYLVQYWTECEC